MSGPARIGIRGRLFFAVGAVAATTIVATVVGWLAFARLGETLDLVVGRNVPAVTAVARLAERGGAVIGTAQALASVKTDAERARLWENLPSGLDSMDRILTEMIDSGVREEAVAAFGKVVTALRADMQALNDVVASRLARSALKEEQLERLRWATADLLDEVEPLIDDTRFNIELSLTRESTAQNPAQSPARRLAGEIDLQRALFKINADGSLMAELIGRAANIPDIDALRGTEFYFREIEAGMERNLKAIQEVPGSLSLRQAILDVRAFANGEDGMFALRAKELADHAEEAVILGRNQQTLDRLHTLIEQRVTQENVAAIEAVDRSKLSIRQGRAWLAFAVAFSIVIAAPIVWVYVGRGVVRRIVRLDRSMRAIADGDLNADVPVSGEDEIGEMADSLRTFRDTLRETQTELVQAAKLAALGQLTAGISHEINQPLAAIRHYSRNTGLLIEQNREDEARDNLNKIDELVEKTNRIISSLRALSRKPQHGVRRTDLALAIDEALALLQRRIAESAIAVEISIDDGARYVMAGQVRLEQVCLNLLGNAIDAMKDAPVRRLIITARTLEGWVELRIRDTGCGIGKAAAAHIFDPFFTTKDVGEGLGLGLSVTYNIVRDFGGTIRAEDAGGDGTAFKVRLKPAAEDDDD